MSLHPRRGLCHSTCMSRRLGLTAALLILSSLCTCQRHAQTSPAQATVAPGPVSFMLLADGSFHTGELPPQWGFYILGKMDDQRFIPEGPIRGEGELGEGGTAGWIELIDGSFHPMYQARAPLKPYVKGYMSEEGVFCPASRNIDYGDGGS